MSKNTMLTRYSAALRLPPSLPLMSPYGLPAAGYPASARWHVFAPAQLIHRLPRAAPPSELPCGSLSRPSPKISIRPTGQPSAVFDLHRPRCCALRANLRLVYLQLSRACDSRPSPKVSIRPSGQPSVALGSASLRLPTLGYTFVSPLRSLRFRAGVLAPATALDCLGKIIGTAPRLMVCALTRSLPLILPYRAPCGSRPSGFPSRLGRVRSARAAALRFLKLNAYKLKTSVPPIG